MIKFYTSISEWICDTEPDERDDVLEIEMIYTMAEYEKKTVRVVDIYIESFIKTNHIQKVDEKHIKRMPWKEWNLDKSNNIVNMRNKVEKDK